MLTCVTTQELAALIARDHPFWDLGAIMQQAQEYHETMDRRLETALRAYLDTGEQQTFRHGDFSLFQIQQMRPGRSYFTALTMMNAYLRDPESGRALILRR